MKSLASIGVIVLAACALPAAATNRCITPEGRIVYTDSRCESLGAKPHGQVRDSISVVPGAAQKAEPVRANPTPQSERNVRAAVFRKSSNAPTLRVCYDPKDARADVPVREVESAIRDAFALWNAGCNINYEYLGVCPADADLWQRTRADYKVYWSSWDNSLTIASDSDALAREHAVAMAGTAIGVSLNRDASVPAWRWQRAIAHEFGHVVGVGHSADPGDLMFSGGKQRTPTAADYKLCNQAIELRHGVKAEFR
jgi:Matrixin/Domain of unknown function (DUF4124)